MTPTTNPLIAFLVETFQRFFLKSPKFFKIWKIITGIPVLLVALPNALEVLNIQLPQIFSQHIQDIVGWAATAMFMMSFLPTQSPVVGVDQKGQLVKQANVEKLPFTSVAEKKEVIKETAKAEISIPQINIPASDIKPQDQPLVK